VSGSKQRLSARDYKHASKRSNGLPLHYRAFAAGLGIGLLAALAVYMVMQRAVPAVEAQPKPQTKAKADDPAEPTDPATQYDFYDMLPKFEVVIPEKERDARRDTTSAPVEQPGAYVLQVGSYKNEAEAERVRGQLAKQGIEATVQRVAVDADVWHRVRIGPFRDLARLNATRKELRAAGIDIMMLRVGD
jgi:cell division protein FtsN